MNKTDKKIQRQVRTRKKIASITNRPRLSVFRSNNYCYAQVIDKSGNTLFGISEKKLQKKDKSTPVNRARELGIEIAKMAKSKKIIEVVFDKGRFSYHGRVKAIAEGAREGGLKF